ncbi:alpha/beta hydrolase [Streptomyces sp. S07_1.15]|uniref:alpha/beta fold hydrolase n=1 Tax=Streptomyces sp. S07_1.15 TaxID=2873925 RepID=UPI001D1333DA|nr:alpha/beta fold hydrolase [Streptomyces sp. S07_1.15]MCC3653746.1 alpha/beta hydrolase [Streptomyces sp. S07_1.15]
MGIRRERRGTRGAAVAGASVLAVFGTALTPVHAQPQQTAPQQAARQQAAAQQSALRSVHRQRVRWERCDFDARMECATVRVPLDYREPGGERIGLAVSRLRTASPLRRGVLLSFNGGPGGDGGLGVKSPQRLADTPLRAAYDLVGFDPRGTGGSAPVMCGVTVPTAEFDSRPDDSAFPALVADTRAKEAACARTGGAVRRTLNSATVARDMDVIRAVLRERKLNFLGYGDATYTGAVYGTLFPRRMDRSVLDSSRNPEVDWRGQYKSQAYAIRDNVDAWAAWTGRRDGHFGLGTSGRRVIASVERAADSLAETSVGYMDRTGFDAAVGALAADRTRWDDLGDLVSALVHRPSDPDTERRANAALQPWEEPEGELRPGAVEAATCEDDWPTDMAVYREDMRRFKEKYPYGLGVLRAQPWVCAFRSFTPSERPPYIRNNGYPKGLVVHAEGNPVLRHAGGRAMAERLGHRLVTVADDGSNDVYAVRGNRCVDARVTAYLLTGVLPRRAETVCAGAPRPDVPADRGR